MMSRLLIAVLAACCALPAFAQKWSLSYQGEAALWSGDLDLHEPTDLRAKLYTRPKSVMFPEGEGLRVVRIEGTRNGVPITGLWTPAQGRFFTTWRPDQGILPDLVQKITTNGIGYLTADGLQHVVYGATTDIDGDGKTTTQYFEVTQLASSGPYFPWVTFFGSVKSVRLKPIGQE